MNDVLSKEDSVGGSRHLCFSLENKKFAIPLLHVKEVIASLSLTPIPQSPEYFKGLINLRGELIPVIDLKQKLKIGKSAVGAEAAIIILDLAPLTIGIIVDSVDCVEAYDSTMLSEPPALDSRIQASYIVGVAHTIDSMTLILDMRQALDAKDYKVLNGQTAQELTKVS